MANPLWLEPKAVNIPAVLREFVGGHPLVARTLVRRGISTVDAARAFLDPADYTPASPDELPDLIHAAERLEAALQRGEQICVWGDFDVDGQTSTALLVAALRELGGVVSYHIPVRATESHGVTIPYLAKELDAGAQLLLTCDTGVAAHEAIAYAVERDVEVIVTDHHEVPPEGLPAAYAVVNPHRLPEAHPLATLPGVGVAYKLVEELYARAGRPAEVQQYLDLVALGIVADVATQRDDARYLLQLGLEALRNTQRVGLQALMRNAQVNPARLNAEDIGFGLGPRLNALGRLADANLSVEFFTTTDLAQARIIAAQLENLNNQRKSLGKDLLQGAEASLERDPALLEYAALVLANPHWHPGVIGITASRLVERYQRPVILIAAPEGELARGSARSVEGCHITDAIATQQHLLAGYGGHAMAAGLAIEPERIPEFRRGVALAVREQLGAEPPSSTLPLAGYLTLEELSLELVDDLARLAPFGAGNPPLTLATRNLKVLKHRTLGRDRAHLKVTVQDESGATQQVLWWWATEKDLPAGRFDLAYTVQDNFFRGQRSLQVMWQAARPVVQAAAAELAESAPRELEIVDYRQEPHPGTLLKPLLAADDVALWAEVAKGIPGQAREVLEPAVHLVIWTIPPGPAELQTALELVQPEKVTLFAQEPGLDRPRLLLTRLAGLVKYALQQKDGRLELAALAAATAQRESTVRQGIAWLAARGQLVVQEEEEGVLLIVTGEGEVGAELAQLTTQLEALLAETAAYRKHFRQGEARALLASE
ncbi:MAG: single-stranded-DNA-specific exonuclease RecJ [Chloroflexota bacterium]|nr:single-stranded-DNA-specific exonuclease RecJ [Chloroflexota bacterium]